MAFRDLDDVFRKLEKLEEIQSRALGSGWSDGDVVKALNRISEQVNQTNRKLDDIYSVLIDISVNTEK